MDTQLMEKQSASKMSNLCDSQWKTMVPAKKRSFMTYTFKSDFEQPQNGISISNLNIMKDN